ncbi:MAG: glycosyltransferase [Pseudomonadota bacterium]
MSPTVLHVTPYMAAEAGGPPVVVDRLARRARAHGYTAQVLTTASYTSDGGAALAQRMPAMALLPSQRAALTGIGRQSVVRAVDSADIVHLHTLWSPLVATAARAARRRGVPYILAMHGMLDPWSMEQKGLRKRIYWTLVERQVAEGATRLVYTTRLERERATGRLGHQAASAILPLGADAPPAPPLELAAEFFAGHPGLAGRPLLLFLGRLHPKKRPEALIAALPSLRAAHAQATAVFVGTGPSEAGLRAQAAAAGLGILDPQRNQTKHGSDAAVAFLGHLEGRTKWQALAAATLFALPSRQENFAIAVAEALRCGVPCLLTPEVAIADQVIAAGAGRPLDPADPVSSLAAQSAALLDCPAERAKAAAAATALAERAFTWPSCARATYALYDEILARNP